MAGGQHGNGKSYGAAAQEENPTRQARERSPCWTVGCTPGREPAPQNGAPCREVDGLTVRAVWAWILKGTEGGTLSLGPGL